MNDIKLIYSDQFLNFTFEIPAPRMSFFVPVLQQYINFIPLLGYESNDRWKQCKKKSGGQSESDLGMANVLFSPGASSLSPSIVTATPSVNQRSGLKIRLPVETLLLMLRSQKSTHRVPSFGNPILLYPAFQETSSPVHADSSASLLVSNRLKSACTGEEKRERRVEHRLFEKVFMMDCHLRGTMTLRH